MRVWVISSPDDDVCFDKNDFNVFGDVGASIPAMFETTVGQYFNSLFVNNGIMVRLSVTGGVPRYGIIFTNIYVLFAHRYWMKWLH